MVEEGEERREKQRLNSVEASGAPRLYGDNGAVGGFIQWCPAS